jgi:putative transposase
VKPVCVALGVARSNVVVIARRPADWVDQRTQLTPDDDALLAIQLFEQIVELPSYGYRRACALVNRARRTNGLPTINHKRAYRVMAANQLLLPKSSKRRSNNRRHEGVVSVAQSDRRWCSDGFEIKCDSGQTVTTTFTKDCCDREVIAWRAREGKGLEGEPIREMLIESVEKRFGNVEAIPPGYSLEFLSDNGGAYIADKTKETAKNLGITLIYTPVCSPQSNGIAESFVNTFKRDYVSKMNLDDAFTVLAQLPAAFEHFNEIHPHSSLKMQSPREFRKLNSINEEN